MSKILKTVITLTVLHHEEDALENLDILEIVGEMNEGCFVGSAVQIGESVAIPHDQLKTELQEVGNDGSFFDYLEGEYEDDEDEDQGGDALAEDHDVSSYSAWLEDTGEDDSFIGDAENGIPSTEDQYEAACLRAGVVPDWS